MIDRGERREIVDDDPHICEIVQVYCKREGFISSYSYSGTVSVETTSRSVFSRLAEPFNSKSLYAVFLALSNLEVHVLQQDVDFFLPLVK